MLKQELLSLKYKIQNNLSVCKSIGWLFFDKAFRMGVGLIVGVWVTRYLGAEQFGALSYAQAYIALFSVIATLGLDGIVVREIVKNEKNIHWILGTTFILRLLGGIILFFISVGTSFYFNSSDSNATILISIIAIGNIIQSLDTIDLWFQSQVKSQYTVWSRNIAFSLASIVKIFCIIYHCSIFVFALIGVMEILLSAIFLLISYKFNNQKVFLWKFNSNYAKSLLKESWPLILSGFVIIIYMKIDQIMLKQFLGDKEVGVYSVSVKFLEIWYFIPISILTAIVPKMLGIRQKSKTEYELFFQKMFNLFVLIAYTITIAVIITAEPMINKLYGVQFSDAAAILIIQILALVFVFIGVLRGQWLLNENLNILGLYAAGMGVICNILLNLYLIPRYSYYGAAVATLISYILSAYISGIFFKKTQKVFFMQTKALIFYDVLYAALGFKIKK